MKKKIKFLFVAVVVMLVVLTGTFAMQNIQLALAEGTNGGAIFVGMNSVFNFSSGSITGFNITGTGGAIFIDASGTFNMSGGSIYGNTATSLGKNVTNSGKFTMTGGTIGISSEKIDGIYNSGTMNIYGGTIYDNIYSSNKINTKVAATISGTITLGYAATVVVEDYVSTTPEYNIVVGLDREEGEILIFEGGSTEPDISRLNITGFDSSAFKLKTVKNTNGNWTVSLVVAGVEFPNDWKDQVASSTYMTTTITPSSLTSIKFVSSVPSGYTQIGTLSTGLPVYKGTTATDIAFVAKSIYAPENSSELFNKLSKLTTLDMSVFDTSNVTKMNSMFYNCKTLTSLDVSGFNTSNVTNMSYMFGYCPALTSLDVSGFDTSKVTSMYYMFYHCSALTSLNMNGFNTSNVTNMSGMFEDCSALTSLNMNGFNTSNVTTMKFMFCGCSALTSLDVSGFNTSKVTDMSVMFGSCSALTSLNVSNFDTSKVTNMTSMFNGCSALTSLDVSGFNTSNVTTMYYMFYNCSDLKTLNLSSFNTSNVTNMGYMFWNCSALTSLDVSGFNTSNVTTMCYMFYNCSALTSLDLSSFNMTKVTDSVNMLNFGSSNKIQTLKTPYNNTSELSITTSSTLYYSGSVVTSVPANITSSRTYVVHNEHEYESTSIKYEIKNASYHNIITTKECKICGLITSSITQATHVFKPTGICRFCGYDKSLVEYIINNCQEKRTLDIIFEKDKQRKEFFVLKVAG